MKKIYFILLAFLPMMVCSQERIMVIADPHVLAQSLVEEGEAFDNMMAGQRKMIDLSEAAFMALVDTALKHKPALVLIPGDLTKDSEKASHDVVCAQLKRLQDAGINSLVIPGNHDIGGKAFAYQGAEKVSVENLPDEAWETQYAYVYAQAIAKDVDSHSFVAEPLIGVTILGIDGSKDAAAIGTLSEETLVWLLAQADEAKAKGNMIIAMSHWQILEHFDMQGRMESACRFENADDLRDSLIQHGVHLVLTGHFHVNGITTYRDTLSANLDSLVEISTGSPITYPCPYRWLTISKDRQTVSVETENISALEAFPDLKTYSRDWMRVHTENMVPQLAMRVWNRSDEILDKIRNNPKYGGPALAAMLEMCIPATDEEKINLVQKHFGKTAIDLYILHSDANEPEHEEAATLAQAVYDGTEAFVMDMTSNVLFPTTQAMLVALAKVLAEEPVQSLTEDITEWRLVNFRDRTDDLHLALRINDSETHTAIGETKAGNADNAIYDLLGRPVANPLQGGVYIQNGQKMIR